MATTPAPSNPLYAGALPPQAKPFPKNTLFAGLSAGLVAGLSIFGLEELINIFGSGGPDVPTEAIDSLSDVLNGKGSLEQFADNAKDLFNGIGDGIQDGVNGIFGSASPQEINQAISSVASNIDPSAPATTNQAVNDFIRNADKLKEFLGGEQIGLKFGNDFLFQTSNDQLLFIDGDKLAALDPKKFEGLKNILDGINPEQLAQLQEGTQNGLNVGKLAAYSAGGAVIGAGAAAIISDNQPTNAVPNTSVRNASYQQAITNPYIGASRAH